MTNNSICQHPDKNKIAVSESKLQIAFAGLPKGPQRTALVILDLLYRYPYVYISHQEIVRRTGFVRSTVREHLKILRRLEIIDWSSGKQQRKTNSYHVNPLMKEPSMKKWVKALYFSVFITFAFLLSKEAPAANRPLLKELRNYKRGSDTGYCISPGENYALLKLDPLPTYPLPEGLGPPRTYRRKKMYDADQEKALATLSTLLPLTDHGKINLRKYPAVTLKYLITRVPQVLHKREPYRYLLRLAEDFCKINKLYINRYRYHLEREQKDIPRDDENFLDEELLLQLITKKVAQKKEPRPEAHRPWHPNTTMRTREEYNKEAQIFTETEAPTAFGRWVQSLLYHSTKTNP